MPYKLSNSPSILDYDELLLIDDTLIYSRNLANHRHHVSQILQKLKEHQLYLKLEKCEFHHSSIHFLGYVIADMDQGKVEAVKNWPLPTSIKNLQ